MRSGIIAPFIVNQHPQPPPSLHEGRAHREDRVSQRSLLRRLALGVLYVGLIFGVRQAVLSSTKGGAPRALPKPAPAASPSPAQSGPTVTGLSPTQGVRGTPVLITGTGFSMTPTQNTVLFNGVPGTISVATKNQIVVVAPDSATGVVAVTSPAGAATPTPTFTYLPNIFVTPEFAVVPPSGTLQLDANLREISGSQAIEWTVNGVVGGSAQTGTISTEGLYTAPSFVPSCGATVQIKARSVSTPERIAISTATIRVFSYGS